MDLSPQYSCSSPSLSRLTYISINDGTALPTPERPKVWNMKILIIVQSIRKYHHGLTATLGKKNFIATGCEEMCSEHPKKGLVVINCT